MTAKLHGFIYVASTDLKMMIIIVMMLKMQKHRYNIDAIKSNDAVRKKLASVGIHGLNFFYQNAKCGQCVQDPSWCSNYSSCKVLYFAKTSFIICVLTLSGSLAVTLMIVVSRAVSSGRVTTYSDWEKAGLPSRLMRMVTVISLNWAGMPWSVARTVSWTQHAGHGMRVQFCVRWFLSKSG